MSGPTPKTTTTIARWLPSPGDPVTVRCGVLAAPGVVSRWDPSVIVVQRRPPLLPAAGQRVHVIWTAGGVDRESLATVEELTGSAWTARLSGPVPTPEFARRRDARTHLHTEVSLTQLFAATGRPAPARTVDISDGGLRLIADHASLTVGDTVEVALLASGVQQRMVSYVVWEQRAGSGHRTSGLRFRDELLHHPDGLHMR